MGIEITTPFYQLQVYFIHRHAGIAKPTLLLLQIEHSGELIGLYREDRWTDKRNAHGIPNTLLFMITLTRSREKLNVHIERWLGGVTEKIVNGQVTRVVSYLICDG